MTESPFIVPARHIPIIELITIIQLTSLWFLCDMNPLVFLGLWLIGSRWLKQIMVVLDACFLLHIVRPHSAHLQDISATFLNFRAHIVNETYERNGKSDLLYAPLITLLNFQLAITASRINLIVYALSLGNWIDWHCLRVNCGEMQA